MTYSRPTAVNLADAAAKLKAASVAAAKLPGSTPASIVEAVTVAAETYFEDDLVSNKVWLSSDANENVAQKLYAQLTT